MAKQKGTRLPTWHFVRSNPPPAPFAADQGGNMNSKKVIRALSRLRDRLSREFDATVNPEERGALNIAIRSLISAIDIQETLIRFEQGKLPKITARDMDTYEQREEYLKTIMGPIEPTE
jgi:hypothetical protein